MASYNYYNYKSQLLFILLENGKHLPLMKISITLFSFLKQKKP